MSFQGDHLGLPKAEGFLGHRTFSAKTRQFQANQYDWAP